MMFPSATLHVGQPDIDLFLDRSNSTRSGYDARYFEEAISTVKPYLDAGRVRGFSAAGEIVPGITGRVLPGHTPGSAFYTLTNLGENITFVGDIVHVAAVQFAKLGITIVYDVDPRAAASNREKALNNFARDRALIAAPHLPFLGVRHVRMVGKGYRWEPIPYGNRQGL